MVMMKRLRAFTLIELLVVMAIIATLLTIAVPRYFSSTDRARDAALRQTLAATRDAIDKYQGDTGRYPDTLQLLVEKQYLRRLPYDPITQSDSTWVVVPPASERGQQAGVYDVRSGAPGNAGDGTAYAEW
jgi:general secretion pathway protein G